MGQVVVQATELVGQAYLEFYLNPMEFSQSRIMQFGQMYEKFLFEVLDVDYSPQQPSTQKGSLVLAYDRDVSDATPPSSTAGLRQYLAFEDSVYGNVWVPKRLRARLQAPETGFYTNPAPGGDDRLAYQGQVYVACMEPSGLAAGTVLGDIVLRYRIHFFVPQLDLQLPTLSGNNNGTVVPTLTDVLTQFTGTAAGSGLTPSSYLEWLPAVGRLATTSIKMAEGLYRYTMGVNQSGAGAIQLKPPFILPLEPLAAPAPVPQVKVLTNIGTNTSGSDSLWDGLLSIPRGGAYVTQAAVTMSAGAPGPSWLQLMKLGPYLSDLSSVF